MRGLIWGFRMGVVEVKREGLVEEMGLMREERHEDWRREDMGFEVLSEGLGFVWWLWKIESKSENDLRCQLSSLQVLPQSEGRLLRQEEN